MEEIEQFEFQMELTVSELTDIMKSINKETKTYFHLQVNAGNPFEVNTEIFGEDSPGDRCVITESQGIYLEYDAADITDSMELIEISDVDIYKINVVDDPTEEEV